MIPSPGYGIVVEARGEPSGEGECDEVYVVVRGEWWFGKGPTRISLTSSAPSPTSRNAHRFRSSCQESFVSGDVLLVGR